MLYRLLGECKSTTTLSSRELCKLQSWPDRQDVPTGAIVALWLLWVTNCFCLYLRPASQEGIHVWHCKPCQKSIIPKIMSKGKSTAVVWLNGHRVKLPCRYLCLYSSLVLLSSLRSLCSGWWVIIKELATGQRAENKWLLGPGGEQMTAGPSKGTL